MREDDTKLTTVYYYARHINIRLAWIKLILFFSLPGVYPVIAGTILADDHNECSSADSDVDVGQMRKRMNQLLDDALSLYGSRRSSNDYVDIDNRNVKFEGKIKYKEEEVIRTSYLHDKREIHKFDRRSQSAM